MEPDEVRVYVASPERLGVAAARSLVRLLTDDERARCDAFRFDRHRLEYLVTRALVRGVLSRLRPIAPERLRFARTELGRPYAVPDHGLSFNLANHPSLVVCAVASPCELGADVEPTSNADAILEVAETHFSRPELDALLALRPTARRDRAVSLWTTKEAYLKARGAGLSLPLDQFAVSFDDPAAPSLTLLAPIDRDEPWELRTLDVDEHRVAIAARGLAGPLRITVERADALVAELARG